MTFIRNVSDAVSAVISGTRIDIAATKPSGTDGSAAAVGPVASITVPPVVGLSTTGRGLVASVGFAPLWSMAILLPALIVRRTSVAHRQRRPA